MKSRTFNHEGRRPFFFYLGELAVRGIASYPNRQFGVNINLLIASRREVAEFWYEADEYRRTYEELLRRYLAKPKLIRELGQFVEQRVQRAIRRLDAEATRLVGLSDERLWSLFKRYADSRMSVFRGISIVRRLDTAGLESLLRWLSKQPKSERASDAVTALCATDQVSFLAKEEFHLLSGLRRIVPAKTIRRLQRRPKSQLLRFLHQHSRLQDFLDRQVRLFAWVSRGYYDEPARTKQYYEQEIVRLVKQGKPITVILRELRYHPRHVRRKRGQFVRLFQLGPRQRTLIAVLQHAVYFKDLFREHTAKLTTGIAPLFEEIGRRHRVKPNDVRRMSLQEIEALFFHRRKVPSRTLALRRKVYLMRWTGRRVEVTYGRRADAFMKRYFGGTASDSELFRGRVASPGKGRGMVTVIHGVNDLPKFKRGHVLVVNNTTPDFVPIMKQAVAIVAEEGGITAHVSVVSREFGIPCVVGVENATRIFRNGDKVEVDATKGLVRKLA